LIEVVILLLVNSNLSISEIGAFLRKHWEEPIGAIVAIASSFLLVRILFDGLFRNIAYGVGFAIVVCFWLLARRIPRTAKGKVGFLVCIPCEKQEDAVRLREDFIETLHGLIGSGETGKSLELLVTPNSVAKSVRETEQAMHVLHLSRAHFMLYGRARMRKIRGRNSWILDLNGIVTHRQIPQASSRRFAQEFRELLPKQLRIETEVDVFAFETTSKLIDIVARYIMGIAASLSGDFAYAESLFRDVKSRLPAKPILPPHVKIKNRLPKRLMSIHMARASIAYVRWLESHYNRDVEDLCVQLTHVSQEFRETYEYTVNQALCVFLRDRDPRAALNVLQKNPYIDRTSWQFSVAFLLAYKGDLKNAVRHYRIIQSMVVDTETLRQVEEFLFWLEDEDPKKCCVNYCLAYINWRIKDDRVAARNEFQKFLAKVPQDKYLREQSRVRRILDTSL
jgi:hypothetical protein